MGELKRIEEVGYVAGLFVGHGGIAGDGEFLGVNALGNRERQVMPFGITALLVGRNRIMDFGLNAIVEEILAKLVATGAENGEDMPNGVALKAGVSVVGSDRDGDGGVVHLINIYSGDFLATLAGSVKVAQFGIEDGGLELVNAGVAAKVVEDIVTGGAVVAEGADQVGEGVVVGSHGTGVAKGTEVFRGVEGVGGGVAKGASTTTRR